MSTTTKPVWRTAAAHKEDDFDAIRLYENAREWTFSEENGVVTLHYLSTQVMPERKGASKVSETKHDGKLPGGDTYEVSYDGAGKDAFVCIQGTHNLADHEAILEPKQALSLLIWLLQERGRLEELAKEQAE